MLGWGGIRQKNLGQRYWQRPTCRPAGVFHSVRIFHQTITSISCSRDLLTAETKRAEAKLRGIHPLET